MSNSPLVSYTRISPNKNSPRNQNIYIISPHCVVGQVTVERLGEIFASTSRDASSNYGIGYDGRVGMYVEEKDRSWCTSSSWNDNRAVTIEVASDTYHPYAITDEAYYKLIDLMADICKRNGKTKILWFGDREKTLNYTPAANEMIITVHRWFDNKSCPGDYIYSRLGKIADAVNKKLNGERPKPKPSIPFERIAGNNRYNTAKATANIMRKNPYAYTVVSGENFADALSAAHLAEIVGSPLILTSPAKVEDTLKYMKEHDNLQYAYLIGGEGVIPGTFEDQLEGYKVKRIAGNDRYETNLKVLDAIETPNAQLIIASGKNFPDGLCAGMINRPVMLVGDDLRQDQIDYIKERGFTTFYVFGGEGAVNTRVTDKLSVLGTVDRTAGSNRYATSIAIAKKFYPNADTVVFASGKNFPDGLCACNLGNYPLILVDNNAYFEAQKYLSGKQLKKAYVVGGTGVLEDYTINMALTPLEKVAL